MKIRQLTLTFTIFLLCVCSVTQTSMVSCNKNGSKDKDADAASMDTAGGFLEKSDNAGTSDGWKDVSANVVKQIESSYKKYNIDVVTLEKSNSDIGEVRMVVGPREGMSIQKELLDGLRMLFETYPKLDKYIVNLSREGDPSVEGTWPELVAMDLAGYTMDTPMSETAKYWAPFEKAQASEEAPGDNGVAVTSENQ
jgi:hypothetical protein